MQEHPHGTDKAQRTGNTTATNLLTYPSTCQSRTTTTASQDFVSTTMLAALLLASFVGLGQAAPVIGGVQFDPKDLVYILSGRDNTCLSVGGGDNQEAFSGLKVISTECKYASTWIMQPSGSILLANAPTFALDAGENPANFGELKIWQSYPGLMQQT